MKGDLPVDACAYCHHVKSQHVTMTGGACTFRLYGEFRCVCPGYQPLVTA